MQKFQTIKVHGSIFHYWVLHFDEPSKIYRLQGGKISKLMLPYFWIPEDTLEQKIAHGAHPVLRWMMDNIFIRTDPAGISRQIRKNQQRR